MKLVLTKEVFISDHMLMMTLC